jgi:hypothetical protein
MAVVRLEERAGELPPLPDVCVRCGAPATVRPQRTFSWSPPWTCVLLVLCNPLIFAAVSLALMKRRRLDLPLCREHEGCWRWRQHALTAGLILNLAWGALATILLAAREPDTRAADYLATSGVGLLFWGAALLIQATVSPRPGRITSTSVVLRKVSDSFASACRWDGAPPALQLDEVARQRWNTNEEAPARSGRPGHVQRPDDRVT